MFQILDQDGLQQQVGGDKRKASDDCDSNKDLKKVRTSQPSFFSLSLSLSMISITKN